MPDVLSVSQLGWVLVHSVWQLAAIACVALGACAILVRRLAYLSRAARGTAICVMLIALLPASDATAQESPQKRTADREQIGTVFGDPVYRDQIHEGESITLAGELARLFTAPVWASFVKANDATIKPTDAELVFATRFFAAQQAERLKGSYGDMFREKLREVEEKLKRETTDDVRESLQSQKRMIERMLNPSNEEAEQTANHMLRHIKAQRLVYDRFGGGRVLFQQSGPEAFDAMHSFFKKREATGDFTIRDKRHRTELYGYYHRDHGSFLVDDKEQIRSYLEPAWLLSEKQDDAASNGAGIWSEPVNGLSARLLMEPEEIKSANHQSSFRYKVILEVKNVQRDILAISSQPSFVDVEIRNAKGELLPDGGYRQSGPIPLPQWAHIPGNTYMGVRVDMTAVGLPRGSALVGIDGYVRFLKPGTYTVRATLSARKDKSGPNNQWLGDMKLPAVTVTFALPSR